jgi:hypothetical protein
MTRALLAVMLMTLTACKSGGSRDWYSGPAEHRAAVEHGLNAAQAELPKEVGIPLPKRPSRIVLTVKPAVGHIGGHPYIISPSGEKAGGYSSPGSIVMPEGFKPRTLTHECGHPLLWANGVHGDHHRFPFFQRYSY